MLSKYDVKQCIIQKPNLMHNITDLNEMRIINCSNRRCSLITKSKYFKNIAFQYWPIIQEDSKYWNQLNLITFYCVNNVYELWIYELNYELFNLNSDKGWFNSNKNRNTITAQSVRMNKMFLNKIIFVLALVWGSTQALAKVHLWPRFRI